VEFIRKINNVIDGGLWGMVFGSFDLNQLEVTKEIIVKEMLLITNDLFV
jgi:hypothetical protein